MQRGNEASSELIYFCHLVTVVVSQAFQEDMATQQPNMDALNKVAKKRKAANPHANPEMTKKISSLYKRWQKLWLRSSERHRQLLEARTRLKDIALARSFNFDAWRKRFLGWVDQQKLRVADLFRRFDGNHDGMLTRDEFMKGLKASGKEGGRTDRMEEGRTERIEGVCVCV